MSSYDDSPTRRGRRSEWDDIYPGGRDYADARDDLPPPSAKASVGRASVGRASVPSGGSPSGGSPGAGQQGQGQPPSGRGVVGRASVRPVSPSGPIPGDGGWGGDGPPGGGGPGGGGWGPNGPGGPGGPGGGGPRNPFGRWRGEEPDGEGSSKRSASTRAKKARRRNMLIAGFAVFIMLTGAGVVGGTFFIDTVQADGELSFPETTTVYYNDGSLLAKLGEVTRYPLKYDEMNDAVTQSIVASEDGSFWENEGISVSGIMRAAWNNFSGGDQQGGSTITQQYARVAFDLSGETYSRKLREAVLAWKIDDQLSKKQILEYYLNSVPFGRQTYGIEAAAQSFLGKTAKKTAPPEQQVTKAEAMALVLMVKQPNPNPDDPKGQPGYDPTYSPEAEKLSRDRWDYVRGQMREMKYLTAEEDAALKYPKESFKPYNPDVGNGMEKPAGLVVNHVFSELVHSESQFKGKSWKSIKEGGYKIYTTLHPGAQQAAEAAADETVGGSFMNGQPANLQAALVAVEPGTGRVLAYFGGHDGKGSDYGGFYYDEKGDATGVGRYPPGSSFKVYTLAAALKNGVSLKSYWQWTPHDQPGRTGKNQIRNASSCPSDPGKTTQVCSLLDSTTASLNVPYYELTVSVKPARVLEMARDAGVDYMWTDDRVRQELYKTREMSTMTPGKFDIILGIGQYPISVTDHANGLATFAAGGLRAQAHFVAKVMDGDRIVYGETLPKPNQPRILNQQQINDLTYALSKVGSAKLKTNIGWDTAGKTGTWEYNGRTDQNAHAWMVGFTKKIATAVWVGNEKDEQAIKDKSNSTIWGSGIPASIWQKFMIDAMKAMNPKKENTKFNPPNFIGNENPEYSRPSPAGPAPTEQPAPQPGVSGPPGRGNGMPRQIYPPQ
jgi:membrane peptidoglycan carboxypeptidase